jgi:hypothetical protein
LSSTHAPGPNGLGDAAWPRRRIDQAPGAGSYRYSSSPSPVSRTSAISRARASWSTSRLKRSVRRFSMCVPPRRGPPPAGAANWNRCGWRRRARLIARHVDRQQRPHRGRRHNARSDADQLGTSMGRNGNPPPWVCPVNKGARIGQLTRQVMMLVLRRTWPVRLSRTTWPWLVSGSGSRRGWCRCRAGRRTRPGAGCLRC